MSRADQLGPARYRPWSARLRDGAVEIGKSVLRGQLAGAHGLLVPTFAFGICCQCRDGATHVARRLGECKVRWRGRLAGALARARCASTRCPGKRFAALENPAAIGGRWTLALTTARPKPTRTGQRSSNTAACVETEAAMLQRCCLTNSNLRPDASTALWERRDGGTSFALLPAPP
jgi:hypothetical protein